MSTMAEEEIFLTGIGLSEKFHWKLYKDKRGYKFHTFLEHNPSRLGPIRVPKPFFKALVEDLDKAGIFLSFYSELMYGGLIDIFARPFEYLKIGRNNIQKTFRHLNTDLLRHSQEQFFSNPEKINPLSVYGAILVSALYPDMSFKDFDNFFGIIDKTLDAKSHLREEHEDVLHRIYVPRSGVGEVKDLVCLPKVKTFSYEERINAYKFFLLAGHGETFKSFSKRDDFNTPRAIAIFENKVTIRQIKPAGLDLVITCHDFQHVSENFLKLSKKSPKIKKLLYEQSVENLFLVLIDDIPTDLHVEHLLNLLKIFFEAQSEKEELTWHDGKYLSAISPVNISKHGALSMVDDETAQRMKNDWGIGYWEGADGLIIGADRHELNCFYTYSFFKIGVENSVNIFEQIFSSNLKISKNGFMKLVSAGGFDDDSPAAWQIPLLG